MEHLEGLNARVERRRERRALAADEVVQLLAVTQQGPVRSGMPGPQRALLYLVAIETGLRAAELRSLRGSSFDLRAIVPVVVVAAAYSKRRRMDTVPLRPATATVLERHVADRGPEAPAFDMPKLDHVVDMLKADLEDAGIPYCDEKGRFVDFHALRHTMRDALARSRCTPEGHSADHAPQHDHAHNGPLHAPAARR